MSQEATTYGHDLPLHRGILGEIKRLARKAERDGKRPNWVQMSPEAHRLLTGSTEDIGLLVFGPRGYMRVEPKESESSISLLEVVLNEPFATPKTEWAPLPMRVDHVHFPVYSAIHDFAVAMKRAGVPGPTSSYLCEMRVSEEAFHALGTEHDACGSATTYGRRGDESFIILSFPKFNLPDVLVFSESP